ncbi:hypothetical protein ACN28E_31080 [Archangium lansingense]|uniref:hypothetical protein n=1 Tax=Archangium lansingense TaxID=2995310 RepID=UPI003B7CEE4F
MLLPGGLFRDGALRRHFRFKPVSGELELAIAESAQAGGPLPHRVSLVLGVALEQVGGEPGSPEVAAELCVADRQFLMQRLAILLGMERSWRTVACQGCGRHFDFPLDLLELPVKPAVEGFPFAQVETRVGRLRVRVPNGADQASLDAGLPEARAVLALLARCIEEGPAGAALEELTGEDVARIEEALEWVSPAVVTRLRASCPECGAAQEVAVNPYLCLGASPPLLEEVHTLASTYHWSEWEILALPRSRRRRYLDLIDRAQGVMS